MSILKILRTLTNPASISQDLFGVQTIIDWEIGSDIIFKMSFEGDEFADKGIVIGNLPHKILKYKYWSGFCGLEDKPENYSKLTKYRMKNIDLLGH